MNLQATLHRLDRLRNWERRRRRRMVVDLQPSGDLLLRLGRPQLRWRSVHVAGTKGKGSVCALVEAALLHAGLRAGRYASPHVERINERVSLLGVPIADDALCRSLDAALDARDAADRAGSAARHATWFDVLTAAAFVAFAEAGLDWVVVEVGMGGRLDSTNVVEPAVAVITNIGLEHTEVLGGTVEAIAAEKAGIVKPGCRVVTGLAPASAAGRVLQRRAAQAGVPVRWPAPGDPVPSAFNRALARAVLDELGACGVRDARHGARLDAAALDDALAASVALPARMEPLHLDRSDRALPPLELVLDGAHVDFALRAVLRELRPRHAVPPVLLLGLAADKDAAAMVATLDGQVERVLCAPLPGRPPGWDAAELAALCRARGLAAQAFDSVGAAVAWCRPLPPPGWVLAAGSLRLAPAVRAALRQLQ